MQCIKCAISGEEAYQRWIDEAEAMPYEEYLLTTHWQTFRAAAYEHYGHKCVLCGAKETLNLHHKHYETRGRETISDVILLCHYCHKIYHGK